ncbi:hypothetical protein ACFY3E_00710 [Streptomyces griseorubiginosus]|uniref:hypothetical protein n=1 Tax=Streptomyces griseorubiginosus TaxID=67304 RepID=UPI0036B70590
MGDLHIRFPALTVNGAPHQQLVVHQAEPASATAAAFERLRATGSELAAGSHQKASAPPYAWVEFQARRSGVGNPGSVVQSSPAEGATVQRLDHLDNLSRQVAGGSRWPGWDRDRGRAPCPAHESDILLAPTRARDAMGSTRSCRRVLRLGPAPTRVGRYGSTPSAPRRGGESGRGESRCRRWRGPPVACHAGATPRRPCGSVRRFTDRITSQVAQITAQTSLRDPCSKRTLNLETDRSAVYLGE